MNKITNKSSKISNLQLGRANKSNGKKLTSENVYDNKYNGEKEQNQK